MFWNLFFFLFQANAEPQKSSNFALQFSLPAINKSIVMKSLGSTDVMLSRYVGLSPKIQSSGLMLLFFADNKELLLQTAELRNMFPKLSFIAVCIKKNAPKKWIKEQGFTFPILHDQFQLVSDRYDIDVFPIVYLIDREGRIVTSHKPAAERLKTEMSKPLKNLMRRDQLRFRAK